MFGKIADTFKVPELKRRILFTLFAIVVYRIGVHIPTPGIDLTKMARLFQSKSEGLLGFLDMFSGGALRNFSIFALGIAPYINASIIMQLLIYVVPSLEKLAKEGEEGRKKISQYTRYGTVVIGAFQALGISFMLNNSGMALGGVLTGWGFFKFSMMVVITLTAGTSFIMWLGEKITDKGIGNGISLLIFAAIVSRMPSALIQTYVSLKDDPSFWPKTIILVFISLVVIGVVIYITEATRKIPVQYARKVVGRKVYGGQSTHIPLRLNSAGVIPIIFASSILLFPAMIARFFVGRFPSGSTMHSVLVTLQNLFTQPYSRLSWYSLFYFLLYSVLIIFFSYFYTAITFNPKDLADNMKKYGGFIPGIRAGRWTAEYIDKILVRVTLAGGVFLAAIAILPIILIVMFKVQFRFGGTALLIVVGVALDTVKQMETHLLTRHYEGFMKKKGSLLK
jgi:preprotein translocase subunit SecY